MKKSKSWINGIHGFQDVKTHVIRRLYYISKLHQPHKPTTIIFTKHLKINKKIYEKGVKIITIPDIRWLRRDIKTTSLLPNVLSKQLAVEKNAFESWLIDDGNITEGSASNAWIIKNSNTIVTHPANNKILRGITRDTIIKILKKNGFNIKEKPFNLIEAKNAKEAFLTSSTLSVLPVVKIDNYNISKGKPGDITKKIINLYNNYISKNKTLLSRELKIAWLNQLLNLHQMQFFLIGIIL